MIRTAAYILVALLVLGLVLSLLPAAPRARLSDVTLEGVQLALYPNADPKAIWTFRAGLVKYNPETRESQASQLEDGQRLVNGKLDSSITADTITIDSADNLRTEQAEIYVYNGCWSVKLGQPGGSPVFIDQNQGYQAPYAKVSGPNLRSQGGPLSASFDFESRFDLKNPEDQLVTGGKEKCLNGQIVRTGATQ